MNEGEEIKQLQQEIVQLHNQLKGQQQTLLELHQRVIQLGGQKSSTPQAATATPTIEEWSLENFLGLKVMHLIGIVVLVIGLSIGVKYAIDKELISAGARIGLAYAAGAILYFLSLRLKQKYSGFSAILFSGAMASLYFTTYAAFVYYGLFSFAIAFVIMIGLTLYAAYNALNYNRQEIAVLGLVGAYAIPFLISKNSGRIDLFFLYIAIINTAVVYLAFKKSWRPVAYATQIITWVLFFGWAISQYVPQYKLVGIIAMLYFFGLFLFNALSQKLLRSKPLIIHDVYEVLLNNIALYVGSLILFAPSFSADEIAVISFVFSLFIGAQAALYYYLWTMEKGVQKALGLTAVLLFTIFIANKWDGITVTFLWLLTAVILFMAGAITKAVWLRLSAIGLMAVTLLKLATFDSLRFTTIQKIIAYITLGILLLVVSFFYQKFKSPLPPGGELRSPFLLLFRFLF